MDLPLTAKLIGLFLIGLAFLIHSGRQIRKLNRRGKELQRQWDALGLELKGGGETVLSESQQRKISAQEPKFVEKLQRMEALSIRLSKLLGHSIFTFGRSLERPEGKWYINVNWSNYGWGNGVHDEVTYVTLKERVKGRFRHTWVVVMQYQRDYETSTREEKRHMYTFEDRVVAVLDTISDELEEQIARASQATEGHREQFRKVVEEHPREKKDRFDRIDLLP